MIISNKNNRGQVLVLVAIALVVLLGFAALAIDIGYFYHTKNQLQGAADAAALAGAAKLDGTNNTTIINAAKLAAVNYADANKAAGIPVQISNDGTNALSSSNDITVGSWAANTYTPGVTPPPAITAMQVRARRTFDSPGGGVPRFFGKIFSPNQQDISATAIAMKTPRANTYIAICDDPCNASNPCTYPSFCSNGTYTALDTSPGMPNNKQAFWTSLTLDPLSANQVAGLICNPPPFIDDCGVDITVTPGTPAQNADFQKFESAMLNPNYERSAKEFFDPTDPTRVTAWSVIVPVVHCPLALPHTVLRYAKLHVIAIKASGYPGSACFSGHPEPASFASYPNKTVVYDQIQCIPCGLNGGVTPVLVQ